MWGTSLGGCALHLIYMRGCVCVCVCADTSVVMQLPDSPWGPWANVRAMRQDMCVCPRVCLHVRQTPWSWGSAGRVRRQSETLFMCQENQAPLSGSLPKENKLAQFLGQRGRELGLGKERR